MKNKLIPTPPPASPPRFWQACRAGLFGMTLATSLFIAPAARAGVNGAIFTTKVDGATVNGNIYEAKDDVYLNGGPQNKKGSLISPDGEYYFEVTNPNNGVLLSTDDAACRKVTVALGRITGVIDGPGGLCQHATGIFDTDNGTLPVQLSPYLNTPNPGGEYQVTLILASAATVAGDGKHLIYSNSDAKSDNFKVKEGAICGLTGANINDQAVCNNGGLPATVMATPVGVALGNFHYKWTVPNGEVDPGDVQSFQTSANLAPAPNGAVYNYSVVIRDDGIANCTAIASGTVTVYPCTGQGCAIICAVDDTIHCGDSTDPTVNLNLHKAQCFSSEGSSCDLSYSDEFVAGCGNSGVITRTWMCKDHLSGLFSSCKQTITIVDNTAPTITSCPENVTIECGADESPKNTGVATATDECSNCINVSIYSGTTQGDGTFTVGTTGGGADYTGLVGSFKTANIAFTSWHPFGQASFGADITGTLNVAADGDYTFALESDDGSLMFIDGNLVVNNGNAHSPGTANGTATLTAGLHTFEIQFFECCGGPSELNLTLPYGVTYANCVQVGYEDSVASGECVDKVVKTITRTWTAKDACGNVSEPCTQTITVKDTSAPTLTGCPNSNGGTVQCFSDLLAPPTVTASDDCDKDVHVSYVQTTSNGTSSCNNTVTRTWTATDKCGNTATCTQTITVNDNTAPVLSGCPTTNPTIQCFGDLPTPATVTASDNCDGTVEVKYNQTTSNGTSSCNNTVTRTWTAKDSCGNTATCTQTITVNDNTAPVLSGCPTTNPTIQCFGDLPAPATVTASDNCDGTVEVKYNQTTSNGTSSCNNTVTRTWTAKDSCGNTATCTQTITVNDNTKPTIVCPSEIKVVTGSSACGVVSFAAVAADNCDANPKITYTIGTTPITSPYAFPIGTTIVTATAKDACGNVSSPCTFNVTVVGCYTTYTLGGWGAKPSGNNPGTLLKTYFAGIYPSPKALVVGAGYDASLPPLYLKNFSIQLQSQGAVQAYLSAGSGTPGVLKKSYVNPTTKNESGTFSEQVIAVQLNVDFSAASKLGSGATKLGDLKIKQGVPYYAGKTVSEVLAIANKVLAGLGGLPGGTLTDLNTVLDNINQNFDNGTNKGYLVP